MEPLDEMKLSKNARKRSQGLQWLRARLSLVALVLAASLPAAGHETNDPVQLDMVELRTAGAPADRFFRFETSGQNVLAGGHDPRNDTSALLVRSVNASSGRTERVELDSSMWSAVSGEGGLSYQYSDPTGSRGGVKSVELWSGGIAMEAGGENWAWAPEEVLDGLWVHFKLQDEWYCALASDQTSPTVEIQQPGHYRAVSASATADCPEPVCGNGLRELGEDCDDGNLDEADTCSDACEELVCAGQPQFGSTFGAIKELVFDGCQSCHDDTQPGGAAGGLDLRPENIHRNLVNVESNNFFHDGVYVFPHEVRDSYLMDKLKAAAHGTPLPSGYGGPMPPGGLSEDLYAAMEKWVLAGAPNENDSEGNAVIVDETAELFSACLPDSTPLKSTPLPTPRRGKGVQFVMPPWDLPPHSEDEICVATYYDLTEDGVVPPEMQVDCPGFFGQNNPSEKCFYYNREVLKQDAQSHHSIIHLYTGNFEVDDPSPNNRGFGDFTYKKPTMIVTPVEGSLIPLVSHYEKGEACDPKDTSAGFLPGAHDNCAGEVVSSVACVANYGPSDLAAGGVNLQGSTFPSFSGSQESYYVNYFPTGVYSVLPMQGVIVWNSHAFNLTKYWTTMEQWLNIHFAPEDKRDHQQQAIFDAHDIFAQDVPPGGTQTICASWTAPEDANVYRINSHTHRFGVEFTIYEPPNQPCLGNRSGVRNNERPDTECEPGNQDQLIYVSTEYSDPINLKLHPMLSYQDTTEEERTFIFCSKYDNGVGPGSPPIKRQSTSPYAPAFFRSLVPGGPCSNEVVACDSGPNKGARCAQPVDFGSEVVWQKSDAFCQVDGFSGARCDACPVHGGVTTEDEMFIMLGSYFVSEEPPEADSDDDGVFDNLDPCPHDARNDVDGDGVCGDVDNCSETPNADQLNMDGDLLGDACDDDRDGDGTRNAIDAFPNDATEDTDTDGDGIGDNSDTYPNDPENDPANDPDGDGVVGNADNCPQVSNATQEDQDGDLRGDACDADRDGDRILNSLDHYPDDPDEALDPQRVRSERRCASSLERAADRAISCHFLRARNAMRADSSPDYSSCNDRLDWDVARATSRSDFCPDTAGLKNEVAESVASSLEATGLGTGESVETSPACSSALARVVGRHDTCRRSAARKHRTGRDVTLRVVRCDSRLEKGLNRLARKLGDACVGSVDVRHLVEGRPSVVSATALPPVQVLDLPELVSPPAPSAPGTISGAGLTLSTGTPLIPAAPSAPEVFPIRGDIRLEPIVLVPFEGELEAVAAGGSAP